MNKSILKARVWSKLINLAAMAVCVTAFAGTARGTGQIIQVAYPPSTVAGELPVGVTYTLWIPDGAMTLRGVIVHQHGAGTTASKEGSTAAYDLHWQALAKKWDCALLGPSYHVLNEKIDNSPGASGLWFNPLTGSEKAFLKALAELAVKSGHPELETVPWALWGHSGGGIWADVMSTRHPQRVAAMWLRSGSAAMFRTNLWFPQPNVPAAVYAIPTMLNPGVKEQGNNKPPEKGKEKGPWFDNLATFNEYRAQEALVGFAPDPRTGHECGDSRYLAIPFFDACLAMRLPEKGGNDQTLKPMDTSKAWLAPLHGKEAQPASAYKGNPKEAVWLPNEAVAKAWMEYVKTGAVGDTTPPPAPFNVVVRQRGNEGVEIVWDADADFESGIGGFNVLRDGKELVKLPRKPVGKFGRPLFQPMTYHDTPAQPLAEMRFVDTSAQPGAKHVYSVITVNSVGLQSKPSAEAREQKDSKQKSSSSRNYQFDKTISREVVKNYLAHRISMEGLLSGLATISDPSFTGEKTAWHGFDRYDFVMDNDSLSIKPFKAPADEKNGVKAPPKDQRRCIVVVPKQAAPGNPWSWQGCYWDHEPQAEVELLRRGFHIAFITPDPGKQWDAWYAYLTDKQGLAKKPAFVGMSKGGDNAYIWAAANPDKVSCIYADNPAIRPECFAKLGDLAKNDVSLLNVCGSFDFLLEKHTLAIENRYHELGGRITVMIKEGSAHHRHSLQDPQPIADWIVRHMQSATNDRPAFADATFTKSYYYSLGNTYRFLKEEKTYATCRGPEFTECYDRYDARTKSQWGITAMAIIVPKNAAPGNPWVFRADPIHRDALIDQALLAKGFHIVVAPLTAQAGAVREQWDATYKHLIGHGFSKKPVLEGTGSAAGEAYAWAIENPDKVSCIYGENPVLRSLMSKNPPAENLAPLAKARVPLLHLCGSLDPWLKDHTRVVEKRYQELGGRITVIVKEGEGHFLLAAKDRGTIVDFIVSQDQGAR